jgi:hypothetical protein
MRKRFLLALCAGILGIGFWSASAGTACAQNYNLDRFYYYPYYYFPHNYWPTMGPQWPERTGAGYMRPPAYMAYPPFKEPHWRHELWEPMFYYRGFHFWLDQF